jgi:hypothetical protein
MSVDAELHTSSLPRCKGRNPRIYPFSLAIDGGEADQRLHLLSTRSFRPHSLNGPSTFLCKKYRRMFWRRQRASDGILLQLASLLGADTSSTCARDSSSARHICSRRGREEERLYGSLGLAPIQPRTGVDPLGGHTRQILVYRMVPGEVTIHQMTYYFISLHIASHRWGRQKGG